MVKPLSPIYLIAVPLFLAFTQFLFSKLSKKLSYLLFFVGIAFSFGLSAWWGMWFYHNPNAHIEVLTGGFPPPFTINFMVGVREVFFLVLVNFMGFLGSIYLFREFLEPKLKMIIVFSIHLMALNGLILTNDIFNMFVFIEIASIGTYILAAMKKDVLSFEAGFKNIMVGSVSSIFVLLGVVFIYKITGTLNITSITEYVKANGMSNYLVLASFVLLSGLIIELKIFPINGWAVDLYDGIYPGIAAIVGASVVKVFYVVFGKLFIMFFTSNWQMILIYGGLITFLSANWFALAQKRSNRLLGYSSVAQVGLLLFALGLYHITGVQSAIKMAIVLLVLNHSFSKAGLFWILGIVKERNMEKWRGILNANAILKGMFFIFMISLAGFPPFPGFWAKLKILFALVDVHYSYLIPFVLLGSLFEIIYFFKWWRLIDDKSVEDVKPIKVEWDKYLPVAILSLLVIATGLFATNQYFNISSNIAQFILGGFLLLLILGFSERLQGLLAIIGIGAIAKYLPLLKITGLAWIFALIFIFGGLLLAFYGLTNTEKKKNLVFFPFIFLLVISLMGIVYSISHDKLANGWIMLFFYWELMTLSSFVLIRNSHKESGKSGWIYIVISSFGAFALLGAITMIYSIQHNLLITKLAFTFTTNNSQALWIALLLFIGFGVKMGAYGLHIWAPYAYTYSSDRFTPFFSGSLSKIGVLGMMLIFMVLGFNLNFAGIKLNYILGWIAAITIFSMTFLSFLQEDVKKLLAYSSVGQVGYILLGIAIASPLGWAAAIYHSIAHFLFKTLLFLAIAGVIYRTGERKTYKLGGLIKKMPLSFVSVLFGIIALSGVPPLMGTGTKWLLYTALLEKNWYFILGLTMFSSVLAFLYCFKLIHTIFLGQLKNRFERIKEAPIFMVLPQIVLWGVILYFSMKPAIILRPIQEFLSTYFPENQLAMSFKANANIVSSFGYWNAMIIGIMVGILFIVSLILLFITIPKRNFKKVGQLDIAFAGEVPRDPDELHYAKNFYNYYIKALAGIFKVSMEKLYKRLLDDIYGISETLRRIYTGNAQTYVYFVLMAFIIVGLLLV